MRHEQAPKEFEYPYNIRSFPRVAMAVLLSPSAFFPSMKREGGYKNPTVFMGCCVFLHALIVGALRKDPIVSIQLFAMGMVFPFITAALFHVILTRVFGARGTYESVFRVNAYASAVSLVSWFTVIGFLLELYRIYLLSVGISNVLSVKISRAFFAIVLTMAIYIFFAGLVLQIFKLF